MYNQRQEKNNCEQLWLLSIVVEWNANSDRHDVHVPVHMSRFRRNPLYFTLVALKENSMPEITNHSSEEDNSIMQNTVCNYFPYT